MCCAGPDESLKNGDLFEVLRVNIRRRTKRFTLLL
jgi:hypothetical protein